MALYGLDESHYQATILPQDFVILKATEGTTYVDPTCDTKYQAAKAAGKLLGVYHFADFGDAVAEANYFVANIQGYLGEALLALDVETSTNVAWAKTFLDTVYSLTQVRAMIYMSASTSKAVDWSSVSADYALWVAGYDAEFNVANPGVPADDGSDMPYATGSWPFATIWQYSSSLGTLDRDIGYMSAEAWNKFAQGDSNDTTPQPAPVQSAQPVDTTQTQPTTESDAPTAQDGSQTTPVATTGSTSAPSNPPQENSPQPTDTDTGVAQGSQPVVVTTENKMNIVTLWNKIPINFRHVLHTAWQVGIPVLVVHLEAAHNTRDVQTALIASGAVFLASIKAAYLGGKI